MIEKYYPPFHISSIVQHRNKTLVSVQFYTITKALFLHNLKMIPDDVSGKPHRINASSGGTFIGTETFELPPVSADEARKFIYQKIIIMFCLYED